MGRRNRGRSVDGILVLDKPKGMTSNAALQRAKRLFNAAKAGHTGSLDPLATGVHPLCFGEATKFSQYLLNADKRYLSTFVLGVGTDTLDAEGEEVSHADAAHLSGENVAAAMKKLTGTIKQIPPMYSAIKRNGQPLYKLARQGVEVPREPREVTIHRFDFIDFRSGAVAEVDVDILCTKGTYVRALTESLGKLLGVPAHVSMLRRSQSGPYKLDQSVQLEVLERIAESGADVLDELLMPIDGPLEMFPAVIIGESASFYLKQGQPVLVPNSQKSGIVRVYAAENAFLGVGEMLDDGRLAPRRLVSF